MDDVTVPPETRAALSVARVTGLTAAEARARLIQVGPNALPEAKAPSVVLVFLRQFLSPLIYILLAAALVSLVLSDVNDALFIGVVLLINGIIGTAQEYSAGQAAAALRKLEQPHATVVRDGLPLEIDARELVPGDIVLLEAGDRVPADLQLVESTDLQCDESLLTGEFIPVKKSAVASADSGTPSQRWHMTFAGSMHTPGLDETLRVAPVSLADWGVLLLIASTLLVVMEFEKWWDQRHDKRVARAAT